MKIKRGTVPKAARGSATRAGTVTRPAAKAKRAQGEVTTRRRPADAPPRDRRPGTARVAGPTREQRHGPAGAPLTRPGRPKNTSQAKARAKARKAKAPKVVRPPLRERLITRLAQIDLDPRALISRVPFVVLIIAALGLGLGVTLWLSTDAAERSYQLGHARDVNRALQQQKESLERQVLEAQAAPALAEAARNLGMIPSRDTAHLVQDGAGNWLVVGTPKPAEGVPPPPLNVKLGVDRVPAAPPAPPAPPVPPAAPAPPAAVAPGQPLPATLPGVTVESPVRNPAPAPLDHAAAGPLVDPGAPVTGPAPGPVLGPAPGPAPDATAPATDPAVPPAAPAPAPAAVPAPAPVAAAAVQVPAPGAPA